VDDARRGAQAPGDSWFRPVAIGSPQALTLSHLEMLKRQLDREGPEDLYEPGQRWLLGYAIPPFQRPLVWTTAQKVAFVESAAQGLHLGTWVYNDALAGGSHDGGSSGRSHRTDRWLIDGQQRFDALDAFWSDAFPVFGKLWSEIGTLDRRRFLNQNFSAQMLQTRDELNLRRIYDRLNFGGTPHTPDQRALPEEPEAEDGPAAPGFR
jgi:hypothetical protein